MAKINVQIRIDRVPCVLCENRDLLLVEMNGRGRTAGCEAMTNKVDELSRTEVFLCSDKKKEEAEAVPYSP